jgi:GNAT superfamily N-acetyltransferase
LPLEIRHADPGDATTLAELFLELLAFMVGFSDNVVKAPEDKIEVATRVFESLLRRDHLTFLALMDGAPVGYIEAMMQYSPESETHFEIADIFVGNIMVRDGFRSRGIGRALLDTVKERGKKAGYNRINLNVLAKNADGRRFYESYGFEEGSIKLTIKI